MDQLVRVIGPAPSELSFPDLLVRLGVERKRAIQEIELFQGGGKKTTYAQEISSILKKAGISGERLQELIREKLAQ